MVCKYISVQDTSVRLLPLHSVKRETKLNGGSIIQMSHWKIPKLFSNEARDDGWKIGHAFAYEFLAREFCDML